ncbi:MAG: hypothetical protein RR058_04440 [Oscillospiraceae bacterium]
MPKNKKRLRQLPCADAAVVGAFLAAQGQNVNLIAVAADADEPKGMRAAHKLTLKEKDVTILKS